MTQAIPGARMRVSAAWPLVGVLLSAAYFTFGTYRNWPYKVESDGKYYYQFLVSAYCDHDLDFANNYRAPAYSWMRQEVDHYHLRDEVSLVTGRPANLSTMGPALLWSPFLVAADTVARGLNGVGFGIDTNPWGKYLQYTVMYSAVVYGVLSLAVLARLLRRYFDATTSVVALVLCLAATPLFYYIVFEPSMSHVYDLFTYALFLLCFRRAASSTRLADVVALAVAGGLHILVRPQNLVTVAIFSVLLPNWYWNAGTLSRLGVYLAMLGVMVAPIPLGNLYLFGEPLTIPQGSGFLRLTDPHIWGVLFSLRNGLFSHHPILLLGLVGFVGFVWSEWSKIERQERALLAGMTLALAAQVYLNAATSDWWAGHSFGQRRLVSSLPLFAFGLAALIRRLPDRFQVLAGLGGVVAGLYLTYIHVFLWDYEAPHNIAAWMFWIAPDLLVRDHLPAETAETIRRLWEWSTGWIGR